MNAETMKKWGENYGAWRQEATEEMNALMEKSGYIQTESNRYHLHDDGSIFWEWFHKDGRKNEYQSRWMKQKVKAWKDSKYYVEI